MLRHGDQRRAPDALGVPLHCKQLGRSEVGTQIVHAVHPESALDDLPVQPAIVPDISVEFLDECLVERAQVFRRPLARLDPPKKYKRSTSYGPNQTGAALVKKQAIKRVAARLFAERGVAAVGLSSVGMVAQLPSRGVSYYYRNCKDLLGDARHASSNARG